MAIDRYAEFADLEAFVGDAYSLPSPAEGERKLQRASELINSVTYGAAQASFEESFQLDYLKLATVAQVEFWLEFGEEHDVLGLTKTVTAGRMQIGRLPPRLAPRALDFLLSGGIGSALVGIR